MTTTIQVDQETLDMLKRLRDNYQYKSYDEVIKNILKQNRMKSMAGILGKRSRKWIFMDLRDETDRF